jgi:hypothetical protein
MRECPKCSSTYDDGAKICRICGAIIETVTELSSQPAASAVRSRDWGTHESASSDHEFGKERSPDDDRARDAAKRAMFAHQARRQCAKCGSMKLIADARIRDQGEYSNGRLQVVIDGQPDAPMFKDSVFGGVIAEICGECGYMELRAENPGELYGHYVRSRGTSHER